SYSKYKDIYYKNTTDEKSINVIFENYICSQFDSDIVGSAIMNFSNCMMRNVSNFLICNEHNEDLKYEIYVNLGEHITI
ncbi:CYIR protein, partial [Plasmodium cynomolgi strain B]